MGNRLKYLRGTKRISLRELGEKVNINFSTLSKIERDAVPMTQEHMETLSRFFNVSIDYLLGKSDNSQQTIKSAKRIPIYSQIDVDHGGNIIVRVDYIQGYIGISDDIDDTVSISMTASDDSMKNTGIMRGDILLINKKGLIENNSIVAITAKGGGAAVVRKHVVLENKKLLVSDVGIEPMDDNHFIIGKVIGFSRVF